MLLFYISHGYGAESTKSVSQPLPGADGTADRLWVTELPSLCLYTPPRTGLSCCPSQGLHREMCEQSAAVWPLPQPCSCRRGERRHSVLQLGLSWSSEASGPGLKGGRWGRRQSMVILACAVKKRNSDVPISSLGVEGETSARQARVQATQNHGCA